MRIKMVLISKDINIKKICTNQNQINIFKRDMPAKHGLQFSRIPYVVGEINLEAI